MFTILKALANFLPFLTKSMEMGGNPDNNKSARLIILLVGSLAVTAFLLTELDKAQGKNVSLSKEHSDVSLKIAVLESEAKVCESYKTINARLTEKNMHTTEAISQLDNHINQLNFTLAEKEKEVMRLKSDIEIYNKTIENQESLIFQLGEQYRELKQRDRL